MKFKGKYQMKTPVTLLAPTISFTAKSFQIRRLFEDALELNVS